MGAAAAAAPVVVERHFAFMWKEDTESTTTVMTWVALQDQFPWLLRVAGSGLGAEAGVGR